MTATRSKDCGPLAIATARERGSLKCSLKLKLPSFARLISSRLRKFRATRPHSLERPAFRRRALPNILEANDGRMNMATKTCKKPGQKPSKAHIVTEKEAAAIDFEPWSVDMKFLPTNDEFIKDGLSHLITCRLALGVM